MGKVGEEEGEEEDGGEEESEETAEAREDEAEELKAAAAATGEGFKIAAGRTVASAGLSVMGDEGVTARKSGEGAGDRDRP